MFDINWEGIFIPSLPILEIFIRGTVMYLILFALLRFAFKRIGSTTVGLAEILMIALVAAAAQNAMARDHQSLADGLLLIATIVFWTYVLDWLGHRFPRFQRWYHPPPLLLVKDGVMLPQNMRQELITEDELMTQLRREGITDVTQVKEAYMEGDGSVTAVVYSKNKGDT
ncbi:MAG: DUF421 domain-containing protein [Chloroflexi bacterium]|nr:DUF421 domain-containing protein [Chloroflexota bacterium]